MTRPANILIVDDNESVLESLKRSVEDEGNYRVLTAKSATEALYLVERKCIHCIALDVILTNAHNDKTGFDLAKKLGKTTPKFFLTCLDDGDSTQEGLEMKGEANVVKYLFKRQGEQAILKTIKDIVKGLNLDLTIHWGTWTSLMLVEMFKHFKDKSNREKRVIAEELETLLCSAFKSATEVTLLEINRGKGGCVVAKVRPRLPEGTGAPVMVKFGPHKTIMQEYNNYTAWVTPYLQHERTQVIEEPAQTFHLAAIKYSFVGGSNPKGSFKEFFVNSTAQEIKDLIAHLIGNTCEKWYEARRPPKREESLLDELYRKRESLNLLESDHVKELEKTIAQLLSSKSYAGILKAEGPALIEVRLNSVSEHLPNPMVYAFRERWNNGYEAEIFPSPSLLAITHGDLNGENIVVNDHGRGFLIDFYKTGFSHIYRDFVELESIIKFELLQLSNLPQRYRLESDLLAPAKLSDPIPVAQEFAHDAHVLKVISVIEQLRRLAALASNSDDPTEYYVGLMFNSLKEILGFSSGHDEPTCCEMRQFHALLSAAKICQKLLPTQMKPEGPGSPPLIFLSYVNEDLDEVNQIYKRLSAEGFKPWMDTHDIGMGGDWERAIGEAIEEAHTVFFVLSKVAVEKRGYAQYEKRIALKLSMQKLADDRHIIPVLIEKLEPDYRIPRELRHLQAAKLYEPDGWDRLLQSLRESVARRDK